MIRFGIWLICLFTCPLLALFWAVMWMLNVGDIRRA